jgi:hypothetical protein
MISVEEKRHMEKGQQAALQCECSRQLGQVTMSLYVREVYKRCTV